MYEFQEQFPGPIRLYRRISLAALLAGPVLWVATGDWQWNVTVVSAVYALGTIPAFAGRNPYGHGIVGRFLFALAIILLLLGLNRWAWFGDWRAALAGALLFVAVSFVTHQLSQRRNRLRLNRAADTHNRAAHLERAGSPDEAAELYRQVLQQLPDDDSLATQAVGIQTQARLRDLGY